MVIGLSCPDSAMLDIISLDERGDQVPVSTDMSQGAISDIVGVISDVVASKDSVMRNNAVIIIDNGRMVWSDTSLCNLEQVPIEINTVGYRGNLWLSR